MPQLQFEVTHQTVNRVDTFKPVAGSKGYLSAHFEFLTDEWNNTVTAIFTKGDISYEVLLDADNNCVVPWEVITEGGDIFVSCFCDDLITTTNSRIYIAETGYLRRGNGEQSGTDTEYIQPNNETV